MADSQKKEKTAKRKSSPQKTDSDTMGILIGLASGAYIMLWDRLLTFFSPPRNDFIGLVVAAIIFGVAAFVVIKENRKNKRLEAVEAERREKERAELHRQLDVIQEQLRELSTHPHTSDAQSNVRKNNSHKSNTRKKK